MRTDVLSWLQELSGDVGSIARRSNDLMVAGRARNILACTAPSVNADGAFRCAAGTAGRGGAGQSVVRFVLVWQAWLGMVEHGEAVRVLAWQAWFGAARQGRAGRGRQGPVRYGLARSGVAR